MSEKEPKDTPTILDPNVMATIRAALWPLVALITIVLLASPVRRLVDQLPDLLIRAEEVSLGGVSLKFANLPKPSQEVANAINRLKPSDFYALARLPQQLDCISADPNDRSSALLLNSIVGAGLLDRPTIQAPTTAPSGQCFRLSDTGVNVLTWVIELVGAQVKN